MQEAVAFRWRGVHDAASGGDRPGTHGDADRGNPACIRPELWLFPHVIDHEREFVFVHIPKTGGNSMNRLLGCDWSPHRDLEAYAGLCAPDTVARYFCFALVRNPWARLYSDYNFQRRKSRGIRLHLHDRHGRRRCFRDWVEAVFDDPFRHRPDEWGGKPTEGIHRWSPQVEWISLAGRLAADRVIPIERAAEEIPEIARRIGLPQDARLPRRNRRLHFPYRWHYAAPLIDKVGEYYQRDVEAFGYRF